MSTASASSAASSPRPFAVITQAHRSSSSTAGAGPWNISSRTLLYVPCPAAPPAVSHLPAGAWEERIASDPIRPPDSWEKRQSSSVEEEEEEEEEEGDI
eukprot:758507-Hanusia_phi.AAC.1